MSSVMTAGSVDLTLICSSGIACQVYDRGVACTVHSYYGLGAEDMRSGQLMDRATSNVGVSEKLKTVDVVIWDEASMSSARMLELVNALHHRLCEDESEEESLPFAGKQIIVVGEFLQLRPVLSSFDSGSFMWDTTTSANSLKTPQNSLKHSETKKNTTGKQVKSVLFTEH